MGKFTEYLLKAREMDEACLIDDGETETKTKDDYIFNAKEGFIVAFNLNFKSRSGVKLKKVISGKIIENSKENETYVVETRNGLKYAVPYNSVVWVKTGERWPRGVYEEMKKGSTVVDSDDFEESKSVELGELGNGDDIDIDDHDDDVVGYGQDVVGYGK